MKLKQQEVKAILCTALFPMCSYITYFNAKVFLNFAPRVLLYLLNFSRYQNPILMNIGNAASITGYAYSDFKFFTSENNVFLEGKPEYSLVGLYNFFSSMGYTTLIMDYLTEIGYLSEEKIDTEKVALSLITFFTILKIKKILCEGSLISTYGAINNIKNSALNNGFAPMN